MGDSFREGFGLNQDQESAYLSEGYTTFPLRIGIIHPIFSGRRNKKAERGNMVCMVVLTSFDRKTPSHGHSSRLDLSWAAQKLFRY